MNLTDFFSFFLSLDKFWYKLRSKKTTRFKGKTIHSFVFKTTCPHASPRCDWVDWLSFSVRRFPGSLFCPSERKWCSFYRSRDIWWPQPTWRRFPRKIGSRARAQWSSPCWNRKWNRTASVEVSLLILKPNVIHVHVISSQCIILNLVLSIFFSNLYTIFNCMYI